MGKIYIFKYSDFSKDWEKIDSDILSVKCNESLAAKKAEFVIPNNGQNNTIIKCFLIECGLNPYAYFWVRF